MKRFKKQRSVEYQLNRGYIDLKREMDYSNMQDMKVWLAILATCLAFIGYSIISNL